MEKNNGYSCTFWCWMISLAAGVLAAAMLMVVGDWGFLASAFVGLILVALIGIFLTMALCSGSAAQAFPGKVTSASVSETPASSAAGAASAGTVSPAPEATSEAEVGTPAQTGSGAEPQAGAASAGAMSADAALVKPSAALAGQEELAGRKGSWKYEGGTPSKEKAPAEKATKAAAAANATAPAAEDSAAEQSKPELLSQARAGGADDLKQIKGVGPQMENMLHGMGIFHFDQVGGWSPSEAAWVDANLPRFKGRVARDGWVAQAKILAAGGETEFSKKVEKGGVY